MDNTLTDIESTEDITKFVDLFYLELLTYPEMKPLFKHINFEKHKPFMISFWEFLLLDKAGYTNNMMEKHINLPLNTNHFDIWLNTFTKIINKLFFGQKAQIAITKANILAAIMQYKLKSLGKLTL